MRVSPGPRTLALMLARVACAACLSACPHGEPPSPDASPSVAYPEPVAPPRPPSTPSALPAAAPASTSPPPPGSPSDPSLLPQTRDKPRAAGDAFDARVRALWDAIIADDPERAMPMFFPVGAYQQVKDVPNPAADWRHRLVAAYAHDIHALHAGLGPDSQRAKLARMDVPGEQARWVLPGEEYNKVGYFRVFGSKLRYEVDGVPHAFDVKSLISWRGEWYVVHLSAIK